MHRFLFLLVALFVMSSLANTAWADPDRDCLALAAILDNEKLDCNERAVALNAFAVEHTRTLPEIQDATRESVCRERIEKGLDGLMKLCAKHDEISAVFERFDQLTDAENTRREQELPVDAYAQVLLKELGDGATSYYMEEHPDPVDPMRVNTGVFPASEGLVCTSDAKHDLWRTLRFKRKDLRGLTMCYQSADNRKAFVLSASDDKTILCMHGKEGPKLSAPEAVKTIDACALAGRGKVARRPADTKVRGKVIEKEAKVAPAPPDPAKVAKLCLDWETSIDKFGDKCSALGKRLQRTFRDHDINLRDIPRDGEYKKALAQCTKAAKSKPMSRCAKDNEVKAALKLIGN